MFVDVTDARCVHVFATAVKHVVSHLGIVTTESSANSWNFCMLYVAFHLCLHRRYLVRYIYSV